MLPLEQGYFLPDERSCPDLLAMSAEFAAAVNFYDLKNCKNGNWQELFLCDESAVMALILATDTRSLEEQFLRLAETGATWSQAALIYALARSIDTWQRRLAAADSLLSRGLSWQICTAVEKGLAVSLHGLGEFIRSLPPRDGWLDFSLFGQIWGVKTVDGVDGFPLASTGPWRTTAEIRGGLFDTWRAFLAAIGYLKRYTLNCFPESLPTGRHDPALGLFLAFLQLFQKAQARMNRFTQRHLDFYYHQMLGLSPRDEVRDRAYLVLHPDGIVPEILIPGGTEFSAGKDGQEDDIIYRSDGDSLVTDAQVRQLHTLCFARDRFRFPEHELGYVTGAYCGTIPLLEDPDKAPTQSWPLFGGEKHRTRQKLQEASFGFAVASPVLLLAEGKRELVVTIHFAPFSADWPDHDREGDLCTRFGRHFSRQLLSGNGKAPGRDPEGLPEAIRKLLGDPQDTFYKHLHQVFTLSLTTEDGWFQVPAPVVARAPGTRNGLAFSFSLGPEAPPVVASQARLHGGLSDPGLPVLRFVLNAKANYYLYSFFAGVEIGDVSLEVAVAGVSDLVLYNNHGQLDPCKTCNPFGPLPACNSYLVLGSYEMARKKVHSIGINLEWGDLPRCRDGFARHYAGYGNGCRNEDFQVEVAILQDGQWQPASGDRKVRTQLSLFETDAAGSCLKAKRGLQIKGLHLFKPASRQLSREQFGDPRKARNGLIRLTLTGPDMAFGHREYANLLTRALTSNARSKRRQGRVPVPNPPYIPVICGISLDYRARAVIKVAAAAQGVLQEGGEKIFHLHPFGTEIVYPSGRNPLPLLPDDHVLDGTAYDGNLFIALSSGRPGGVITLFFHLKEDSARTAAGHPSRIAWFYLAGNRWRKLEQSQTLSDSTQGFLSSGIVTLEIPGDISSDDSVMPGGYYWLRVSADGDLPSFCSLYSVQAQALQATRCSKGSDDGSTGCRIAPGTIRQARVSIPGVEKVTQPAESFGGKEKETPQQLVTRSQERLRHKERAVLPWDYERLVLQNFPEVLKVKCFPNLESSCGKKIDPSPGHLLVVVVPRMKEGQYGNLCPKLNSLDLGRIHDLVTGLAAPFVNVEVRNPAYELIRVVCSVRLKRWAQSQMGHYLNLLNQAVSDFISPWQEVGYDAKFGWCIRKQDIEDHLLKQGYLDLVTRFSLLHVVAEDDDCYTLFDTARIEASPQRPEPELGPRVKVSDQVCPRYPWSLAVPTAQHAISAIGTEKPGEPDPTGLNDLEVGQTFIIGATKTWLNKTETP